MAVDTFRRYIWLLETIYRLGYAEFETIQYEWNRSSLNPYGMIFQNARSGITLLP